MKEMVRKIEEEEYWNLRVTIGVGVAEVVVLAVAEAILVADDATGIGVGDDVLIVPTVAKQACTANKVRKACQLYNKGRHFVPPVLSF